jgi:hypothetical protein
MEKTMTRIIAAEPISLDAVNAMDARSLRELDHRESNGIEISLLWQADDNSVYLAVTDHHQQDQFIERVDPAVARDAFEHPYSYRRSTTDETSASSTGASRNF